MHFRDARQGSGTPQALAEVLNGHRKVTGV
jgi:hypothetical protein